MSERLVTIATFGSSVEGNLARNRLEAAGIEAFLVDEETVGMAWHLGNAIGGIKLQVEARDADEALAVLKRSASAPTRPEQAREADVDEDEAARTVREENAARAFRGAVLGLLLVPLQLYVFWLLVKILVSNERLSPDKRRLAIVAALINLPVMLFIAIWLRTMFLR